LVPAVQPPLAGAGARGFFAELPQRGRDS